MKDPAHTGTSKGLSQAINRGPIRTFLPKYANVYITIQSHGLSAGVWTNYVTANRVRNGLRLRRDGRVGRPSQSPSTDCSWATILVGFPTYAGLGQLCNKRASSTPVTSGGITKAMIT